MPTRYSTKIYIFIVFSITLRSAMCLGKWNKYTASVILGCKSPSMWLTDLLQVYHDADRCLTIHGIHYTESSNSDPAHCSAAWGLCLPQSRDCRVSWLVSRVGGECWVTADSTQIYIYTGQSWLHPDHHGEPSAGCTAPLYCASTRISNNQVCGWVLWLCIVHYNGVWVTWYLLKLILQIHAK